ncbi:hypothetical protein QUA30_07725 [Microcoleus sp. Pol14C2]|uniref:hypothetical protein n=1 Tax=unclassified Microcoleus TaxID=2642155 RepID=UPI002FD2EEF2
MRDDFDAFVASTLVPRRRVFSQQAGRLTLLPTRILLKFCNAPKIEEELDATAYGYMGNFMQPCYEGAIADRLLGRSNICDR